MFSIHLLESNHRSPVLIVFRIIILGIPATYIVPLSAMTIRTAPSAADFFILWLSDDISTIILSAEAAYASNSLVVLIVL